MTIEPHEHITSFHIQTRKPKQAFHNPHLVIRSTRSSNSPPSRLTARSRVGHGTNSRPVILNGRSLAACRAYFSTHRNEAPSVIVPRRVGCSSSACVPAAVFRTSFLCL